MLGNVEYDWTVLPHSKTYADVEGAIRVSRARLLSFDLRHVSIERRGADALRKRYGVPVNDDGTEAAEPAVVREATTGGWTTCRAGHQHWGRAGAAGLLIYRHSPAGIEVLLQRRSAATQHGGTWGLPGGALRIGERPEEGALREGGEELGLRAADLRLGETYTDNHGGWSYVTVLARPAGSALDAADLHLDWECTSVAWLPLSCPGDEVQLHPGLETTLPALLGLIRDTELAELHAALYVPPSE